MKIIYTLSLLALTAGAIAQPAFINNGGFEVWSSQNTVTEPFGWYTLNPLTLIGYPETTSQSSDAHTGSLAALLESKVGTFNDVPGLLTSANILTESGMPDLNLAKVPFTDRPKNMQFYYKYFPVGDDSCAAIMVLTRWNTAEQRTDTIGIAAFTGGDTVATYTQVIAEVEYMNPLPPDSFMVLISSSADGFFPTVGSKLFVDDFILGFETGLADYTNTLQHVSAYPNPASAQFTIDTRETEFTYSLLDLQGKEICSGRSFSSGKVVETAGVKQGLYLLEVKSRNGTAHQRIIIN